MRAENVKADAVTMEKVVLACHYLGEWKLVDSMVKYIEDNYANMGCHSWTGMITGYAQANQYNDAIMLFWEMTVSKINPEEITIASVPSSCAHLGTLDVECSYYRYVLQMWIYRKGKTVFQEMKDKDSVPWTSAICGLAMNAEIVLDKLIELDPSNGGSSIEMNHYSPK
ncbi:hypothetical protein ACJIZ3_009246 [Penstemon smallii]|uniref:Pentatricopeptide repeat-containing protein n=1 Tax=Penstemon smallii TaxID=265156 RepID=A0ABD3TCS5_9LAMI